MTNGAASCGYTPVSHWVFCDDPKFTSGQLSDSTLQILDMTGRGNRLTLMTQKMAKCAAAGDYLSFDGNVLASKNGPLGTGSGSLKFSLAAGGAGAYFATVCGELDTEEFTQGYTIELMFSAGDSGQWAAIIGKRGTPNSAYGIGTGLQTQMDGSAQGSFNTGGSNDYSDVNPCAKVDLQLMFNNTNLKTHNPETRNNSYQSTLWSDSYGITRDRLHYAVIRNDGVFTVLYIDGIPALRCDNLNAQPGLDMLDGLGWVIGANYSYEAGPSCSRLTSKEFLAMETAGQIGSPRFCGEIQEIRISKGFVPDDELLVPLNSGLLIADDVYRKNLGHNKPVRFLTKPENYTMAFIPDTQYYTQYKRGADGGSLLLSCALEWIACNRRTCNIIAAMHVGDITESNNAGRSEPEWIAADISFRHLDNAAMPYTVLPGNHDYRQNFYRYFNDSVRQAVGFKRMFSSLPVHDPVTGLAVTASGASSYTIVQGGSYEYLILSTGSPASGSSTIDNTSASGSGEMDWLLAVMHSYPNLPTVLLEHTHGDAVRDILVRPFAQVFLHVWGHIAGSHASWQTGNFDNPGYWAVQINYQLEPYGGNGWIDLFEFDEAANTITMRTFSPYVEKKLTGQGSQWWNGLPGQDRAVHSFDVMHLTRYVNDAGSLPGYQNTMEAGTFAAAFISGNKPANTPGGGAPVPGVLELDFAKRFNWFKKAAGRKNTVLPG